MDDSVTEVFVVLQGAVLGVIYAMSCAPSAQRERGDLFAAAHVARALARARAASGTCDQSGQEARTPCSARQGGLPSRFGKGAGRGSVKKEAAPVLPSVTNMACEQGVGPNRCNSSGKRALPESSLLQSR